MTPERSSGPKWRRRVKTIRIDLENGFEADQFAAVLETEQIPHTIINHHSLAYDGLFQMTRGWGHMEVPAEFGDRALELLRVYRQTP